MNSRTEDVIPDQTLNEVRRCYATRSCPCSQIRLGDRISSENESALRNIAEKLNITVLRYDE